MWLFTRGHSKFGQLKAEGNAGKHTMRHIVRTGSCRESIAIGLNFPTNLCKRKSLNLRNHKKIMNNDESYITLILLDRNELEISYNGGDQGMVTFEFGDVLTIFDIYLDLPNM